MDISGVQGHHRRKFSGKLEKRSRRRAFLTSDNWKMRDFKVDGQEVTYFDESGKERGSFNVKGAKSLKVRPEDAQGKYNAFAVQLAAVDLPDEEIQNEETVFLAADSEATRAKWMSIINASALSEKWMISNQVVQAKSAADIASALLSKRDETKSDFIAGYVISNNFKHRQVMKEYNAEIDSVQLAIGHIKADFQDGKADYNMLKQLSSRLEELKHVRAISAVQYQVRLFLTRRKVLHKQDAHVAARKLAAAIRIFVARRKLKARVERERMLKIIKRVVVRYLANFRKRWNRKRKGQLFALDLINAKHLIGVEDLNAKCFAYTMSCVDKSGSFKGAATTDIKDGYGLNSRCLHESSRQQYSHDPVWEDEEADPELRTRERCYVLDTTSDCYIVVTLMAEGYIRDTKSYLGQAIVKIADHERALYTEEKTVTFRDVPLLRYVAPVEDRVGVSPFSISTALRVSKVTGQVSFRLKLVKSIDCQYGTMEKITNSKFASLQLGSSGVKQRYFVLVHNLLYYNKDQNLFSNKNKDHCLDLEKVTAISFLNHAHTSPRSWTVQLTFQLTVDSEHKKWELFLPKQEVTKKGFLRWLRRIYRACPNLQNPEMIKLRSEAAIEASKDLAHRIDEREEARQATWVGLKQEDALRKMRAAKEPVAEDETDAKEGAAGASTDASERKGGFFKRLKMKAKGFSIHKPGVKSAEEEADSPDASAAEEGKEETVV